MEKIVDYHPYWSSLLAARYDERAGQIRSSTRFEGLPELRSGVGNAEDLHATILFDEYGSMGRSEFEHRINLARTASALRNRWVNGGRQLVDPTRASGDLEERCASISSRVPIYIHLGAPAEIVAGADILLDGLYIEKLSEDHERDTYGLGVVCRPAMPMDAMISLGDLLLGQSALCYGFADSLGPRSNIDLVIRDHVLQDDILRVALDCAHATLLQRADCEGTPRSHGPARGR